MVLIIVAGILLWRFIHWYRLGRPIFTDEHYSEVVTWVAGVVARHPVPDASPDDGTAIVTSRGVALSYTSTDREDGRMAHRRPTRRPVAAAKRLERGGPAIQLHL